MYAHILLTLALVALSTAACISSSPSCVFPRGIDDDTHRAHNSTALEKVLPTDGIVLTITELAVRGLKPAETPIRFQRALLAGIPVYSVAAAFHPTALDFFGRVNISNRRRRCPPNGVNTSQFDLHRRVTLAYTFFYSAVEVVPHSRVQLTTLLRSWGLSPMRCPGGPGCDDERTPWGLAFTLASEVRHLFHHDGWNSDGRLSRETNRVPYEDWRAKPYRPMNSPWELKYETRWQPLAEHNSWGSIRYQDHVVPHIGYTAKSYFLGNALICSMKAPEPNYNYEKEMQLAVARRAALDDKQKAQINAFDTKYRSIFPLEFQFLRRSNISLDSFKGAQADAILVSSIYEGILVTWKEKVRHDLVRPTSIIHKKLDATLVRQAGNQTINAGEWEPYIRTMPHAEYPSGSACMCRAFVRVMQRIAGTDDISAALKGGPLLLAAPIDVRSEETILLRYKSFSEIGRVCSQSRLDGGMHFTASVTAGEQLCDPIANIVYDSFKQLERGVRPRNLAHLQEELEVRDSKC